MNKRGIANWTLTELILVILAIIIGIAFLLTVVSFINPTIGGHACGLNLRVFSATTGATGQIIGAPILMCNQYREPVTINAADFRACPDLADLCSLDRAKEDKEIYSQCIQQCARLQIDALTDSCWGVGGKGQLDLRGTVWDKLGRVDWFDAGTYFDSLIKAQVVALQFESWTAENVLKSYGFDTGAQGVDAAIDEFSNFYVSKLDAAIPRKSVIVRCNRFQIVNPAILPNKRPFTLSDNTFGKTQANELSPELCSKLGRRDCLLSTTGVKAVNPEPGFEQEVSLIDAHRLNYNITEPRQVCYVAYYQYEGAISGNIISSPARTCEYWTAYSEKSAAFLN